MEGTTKPGRGFVVFFYRERCCTGEKIVLRAQKNGFILSSQPLSILLSLCYDKRKKEKREYKNDDEIIICSGFF